MACQHKAHEPQPRRAAPAWAAPVRGQFRGPSTTFKPPAPTCDAMRGALPTFAALLLAGCLTAPPSAPAAATGRIDGAVVDGYLNPYAFQNVPLVNLGLVDQT